MPVTLVSTRWEDGAQVWYEKGNYGDIAELLKIATDVITIGSASQDVDFKIFLGASDQHVTFDAGAATVTFAKTDVAIAGDLSFNANASDIIVLADTDSALEIYDSTTKFMDIDTRVTVTGVANMTLTGMPATIVAASGVTHQLLALVPGTTTLTGATGVTAMEGLGLSVAQPTITDAAASTVAQASTVYIAAAPVAADAATITAAYALHVAAGMSLFADQIYSTNDTGIRFGGTYVPDQNRTDYAIAIGGRAGGVGELDVTIAASTNQNFDPIQMNFNIIGANSTGSSQYNGIYQNVTHDTTDMDAYRIKGADWLFTVGKDILDLYGAQKEIVFNAASITVGGECAVHGMVLDGGSSTVTCAAYRVINATLRGSGTPADAHGIMINAESSLTVAAGLRVQGLGMVDAIQLGNGSYAEAPINFASFPTAANGPVTASVEAGDGAASIKIRVGGVTKYLHYWDNAS